MAKRSADAALDPPAAPAVRAAATVDGAASPAASASSSSSSSGGGASRPTSDITPVEIECHAINVTRYTPEKTTCHMWERDTTTNARTFLAEDVVLDAAERGENRGECGISLRMAFEKWPRERRLGLLKKMTRAQKHALFPLIGAPFAIDFIMDDATILTLIDLVWKECNYCEVIDYVDDNRNDLYDIMPLQASDDAVRAAVRTGNLDFVVRMAQAHPCTVTPCKILLDIGEVGFAEAYFGWEDTWAEEEDVVSVCNMLMLYFLGCCPRHLKEAIHWMTFLITIVPFDDLDQLVFLRFHTAPIERWKAKHHAGITKLRARMITRMVGERVAAVMAENKATSITEEKKKGELENK